MALGPRPGPGHRPPVRHRRGPHGFSPTTPVDPAGQRDAAPAGRHNRRRRM